MTPTVETISGAEVDLFAPRPRTITLRDVAYGLSRLPRYVGHTTGVVYSVAQHSVWCARIAELFFGATPTQTLQHLLHDGHEFVTGDLPAPFKHIPEVYAAIRPIERELQHAIHFAFEVPEPDAETERVIGEVDLLARAVEAYHLKPSRGETWGLPPVPHEMLQTFIAPMPWEEAFDYFWMAFETLKKGRRLEELRCA